MDNLKSDLENIQFNLWVILTMKTSPIRQQHRIYIYIKAKSKLVPPWRGNNGYFHTIIMDRIICIITRKEFHM